METEQKMMTLLFNAGELILPENVVMISITIKNMVNDLESSDQPIPIPCDTGSLTLEDIQNFFDLVIENIQINTDDANYKMIEKLKEYNDFKIFEYMKLANFLDINRFLKYLCAFYAKEMKEGRRCPGRLVTTTTPQEQSQTQPVPAYEDPPSYEAATSLDNA